MNDESYRTCAAGFFEHFARYMNDQVRKDSVLGKIEHVMFSHGPDLVVHQEDDTTDESSYACLEADFEVSREAIESGDRQTFLAQVGLGLKNIQRAMVQQLLQKVEEACEKSGNVVDAAGQPPSADMICEMLEQVEIQFDRNAQPVLPTLVIHPSHEAAFRKVLEDPITELRIQMILQRKWFERYTL